MWFMLPDAYLSIVSKDCADDELMVRARRKGDIELIFPGAKVTRYTKSDYLYRAAVKKDDIKKAMVGEIDRIVYNNFKNSVRDHKLHNAYNKVWGVMAELQEVPPYSGNRTSGGLGSLFYDFGDNAEVSPQPKTKKKAPAKLKKGQ